MLEKLIIQFKVSAIREVGFAESLEGFLQVFFCRSDGITRGEVGFDLGIVAGFAFDFVEIDVVPFSHLEILTTARYLGDGFEAELQNDVN